MVSPSLRCALEPWLGIEGFLVLYSPTNPQSSSESPGGAITLSIPPRRAIRLASLSYAYASGRISAGYQLYVSSNLGRPILEALVDGDRKTASPLQLRYRMPPAIR